MIHYSLFESIMGKSKQKRKPTREPQLSASSRGDRKRAKQDVVHGMIVTSLESKTRGDVYGNVKKTIDNAIAVSPWMTEDSLKCAARRHTHRRYVTINYLIKKKLEQIKLKHQTSVLGLISTTIVNGGRPKGLTLKNKKISNREWVK